MNTSRCNFRRHYIPLQLTGYIVLQWPSDPPRSLAYSLHTGAGKRSCCSSVRPRPPERSRIPLVPRNLNYESIIRYQAVAPHFRLKKCRPQRGRRWHCPQEPALSTSLWPPPTHRPCLNTASRNER